MKDEINLGRKAQGTRSNAPSDVVLFLVQF